MPEALTKAQEAAPDQHAMFRVIEEHLRLFPHMLKNDGIHTLYRIVGTYLAALPQQTAEPVAPELDARLRSLATTLEAYGLDYMQARHVIEKVRAIASPPVGGAVKALEWRTIGSLQQAETSIGWYTVIREPNAEEFPWLVSLRGQGLQSFMREADAKDFAQKHFTECIQGGVTASMADGRV